MVNKTSSAAGKRRGVLVCTDNTKRGVFFGYYAGPEDATVVTLEQARMVVYWSAETKGVLGLAANGPAKGSRVTPACPRLTLQGVVAIGDCTEGAVKRFEEGPWA